MSKWLVSNEIVNDAADENIFVGVCKTPKSQYELVLRQLVGAWPGDTQRTNVRLERRFRAYSLEHMEDVFTSWLVTDAPSFNDGDIRQAIRNVIYEAQDAQDNE